MSDDIVKANDLNHNNDLITSKSDDIQQDNLNPIVSNESSSLGLANAGSQGLDSSHIPTTELQTGQKSVVGNSIPSVSSLPLESRVQSSITTAERVTQGKQEANKSFDLNLGGGGGDRNGSIASSKLSRQGQGNTSGTAPQVFGNAVITSQRAPDGKKGTSLSRFLSALNCCSAPDNATQGDLEDSSMPARKASKLQTSQGRQGTPAHKVDTSAADSSTAESKEISDEKIGGPPYSHIKAAEQPRILEKLKDSAPMTKASILITQDEGDSANRDTVAEQPQRGAEMEPATSQPSEEEKMTELVQPIIQSKVIPASSELVVIPTTKIDFNPNDGLLVIPDEDNDTVMVDASQDNHPPNADVEDKDMSEADKVQSLPPPPPLLATTSEQGDSTAGVPQNQADVTTSSSEKQSWLLPPIRPEHHGKKCLVLDLDETLVHSSFKILHQADFTIPVEIEGQYHNVYVIKRPGVDQFMKRVGELYEVVVFTASVSKQYGDPLLDQLDIHHVVHHRLFRESCYNHQGNYVKDLSQVGRDLRETIIIDNSPTSYIFHPQHAVPISSWFSDAHDNELLDLIPVLEDLAGSQVRDVSLVLDVAL
ncbi:MAG: hypothetical protein MMC33_009780 [Icmadophila ericetorum]|nr:hypothetical protein [Icmadophila ericetorum]